MTPRDFTEVLSSFVDGELVDPRALEDALAHPESGAILVDFARLRASIREDASRPSDAFYRERPTSAPIAARSRPLVPVLVGIAAVALAAFVWVGFQRETRPPEPPEPQRVVNFTTWGGAPKP